MCTSISIKGGILKFKCKKCGKVFETGTYAMSTGYLNDVIGHEKICKKK